MRRGGAFKGAPLDYHLSGSWPSLMSYGQGEDFFKYHEGQHGGAAPYPGSIDSQGLSADMVGPAYQTGIKAAFAEIANMSDRPEQAIQVQQAPAHAYDLKQGGRRRRRRSSRKSRRHSHHRRRRTRGGGSPGYASVNANPMLLSTTRQYQQAGLNPDYITGGVEKMIAEQRDAM